MITTSLKGLMSFTDLYCSVDVASMVIDKTVHFDREPLRLRQLRITKLRHHVSYN